MVYYKSQETKTIYRGDYMMTKLMISLFLFIAFSIGGIIGEETENEDKTTKLCFKIIKTLAFIGVTYNLVIIS